MRRFLALLLILAVFSRVGSLVPTPKPDPTDRRVDLALLQGEWEMVRTQTKQDEEIIERGTVKMAIAGDQFRCKFGWIEVQSPKNSREKSL